MVLNPALGHASVLVGEIDLRGRNGWRGINRLLASGLTGWRIRLAPIAESAAWRSLEVARATRRSVPATVVGATTVNVRGLFAELPRKLALAEGDEIDVRVTRMNADEGTIRVAPRAGVVSSRCRCSFAAATAAHNSSSTRGSRRRATGAPRCGIDHRDRVPGRTTRTGGPSHRQRADTRGRRALAAEAGPAAGRSPTPNDGLPASSGAL